MLLFLGSGASAHFGVPLFKNMTRDFPKDPRYSMHNSKIKTLKKEFRRIGYKSDIEMFLSYAKAQRNPKQTLLSLHPFVNHFVYAANSNGLNRDRGINKFIGDIEDYIYDNLLIESIWTTKKSVRFYKRFLGFLNRRFNLGYNSIHDMRIDIFTTNYDNLIELIGEEAGIKTYAGYNENTSDDFWSLDFQEYTLDYYTFNVYKIHGSVLLGKAINAQSDEQYILNKEGIKLGQPYEKDQSYTISQRVMIYGHDKNPTRDPYFKFLEILTNKLNCETNVVVIGFSFGDKPILNIFKNALDNRPELNVYILTKSANKIKTDVFANYPNVHAIPHYFDGYENI